MTHSPDVGADLQRRLSVLKSGLCVISFRTDADRKPANGEADDDDDDKASGRDDSQRRQVEDIRQRETRKRSSIQPYG